MSYRSSLVRGAIFAVLLSVSGCMWTRQVDDCVDCDLTEYRSVATEIEYPDLEVCHEPNTVVTPPPITIAENAAPESWDMTLQEAVQLGLTNSRVMRDLGGLVLQSPDSVNTIHGPAILESDPRFGVEAALAEFDTSFAVHAFFENNDRALNNSFFGGGTRVLKQDFMDYSMELSKRTAVGGDLVLRHNMDYDANNAPGNQFPSAWNTNVEAEFRQPLLQGAGVVFNRIAGPNGTPGQMRGVLLARTNFDIGLADFEISVRNLVSDIENAYWELHYAYRDLDAKLAARKRALATWRVINEWKRRGRAGGEADKEAQAREQYYRMEEEVQNALTGRLIEPSRSNVFRGLGGVHANERRLRQVLGLQINDRKLIRPSDEPQMAKVLFDWEQVLVEAQARRPELRRQKWVVKRRELELTGSKNFLMPRLDAVGRYRFRGFGKDLLDPNGNHKPPFNDAFSNLTTGDFQEWQLGFELTVPFGYRQAHAAVRNAELQLARDLAVLEEQQRAVSHDLSASVAEAERAYVVAHTAFNRRVAASQQLEALEVQYEDPDPSQVARLVDQLLESHRRLADADNRYHRAIIEYTLAIKNVHLNKGSLLDYNEIHLAEGDWPNRAYSDAAERTRLSHPPSRLAARVMHRMSQETVSQGPYIQQITSGAELEVPKIDGQALDTPTSPSDTAVPSERPAQPSQPIQPTQQVSYGFQSNGAHPLAQPVHTGIAPALHRGPAPTRVPPTRVLPTRVLPTNQPAPILQPHEL